jgi:hypothetical protein
MVNAPDLEKVPLSDLTVEFKPDGTPILTVKLPSGRIAYFVGTTNEQDAKRVSYADMCRAHVPVESQGPKMPNNGAASVEPVVSKQPINTRIVIFPRKQPSGVWSSSDIFSMLHANGVLRNGLASKTDFRRLRNRNGSFRFVVRIWSKADLHRLLNRQFREDCLGKEISNNFTFAVFRTSEELAARRSRSLIAPPQSQMVAAVANDVTILEHVNVESNNDLNLTPPISPKPVEADASQGELSPSGSFNSSHPSPFPAVSDMLLSTSEETPGIDDGVEAAHSTSSQGLILLS